MLSRNKFARRTAEAVEAAYRGARAVFGELGVETEDVLQRLGQIRISIHCWQGDDVGGFEGAADAIGGGLAVTGSYPGKARTPDQLRADLNRAMSLIPGKHRLNLHASYAEPAGPGSSEPH